MDKRDVVYLVLSMIAILIIIRIINTTKDYSCNQCTVEFKSTRFLSEYEETTGPLELQSLFDTYVNEGQCLVTWDKVQGYRQA